MDITIKHFTHTGHSNWVLMNEDGEIVQRNGWQMAGRTRRLAETIALEFAEEMGFSTIRSEYYYGGTRRYKFILAGMGKWNKRRRNSNETRT